ncbi:hypothetical protein [Oscillatoria acuminata]|uniref:Uncharacterized protein n=1 Tax=Oscillatoria acuminata PCC 6304 TaxID=56110 RepID=K9TIN1_9CYAN|nr:hypothetical protein [Oscillatoria acuminata]AFY82707.1 hypothetical protein Oscil6304_3125 [Oscillatoria acuminata PCC 6304]
MNKSFHSFIIPKAKEEAKKAAQTLRELHPELLQPPPKANPFQRTGQKIGLFLVSLIFANPEEFYGKNIATAELVEHSQLTARVISIGSLLNAITNQPILFFAFKDFGNLPAMTASLTLNLLIIKFTNDNGTAVAGRKYGNHNWAKAAAAAMIAMSTLQSIAAAVGSEAMNNRPELSQLKAIEQIDRLTQNLEDMPATSTAYESARQEYEAAFQEFQGMSRSHPNWNTFYTRLFGTWENRDRDWSSVPTENLPLEQRMLRLQREAAATKEEAQQRWNEKLAKRHELGDDVLFLQQQMPELFARHFDENYDLRSGTETIRLAMVNLHHKLTQGDIAGLGFPLFFLILSVVSSGGACWMTLAYAHRKDTEQSRNDAVGEAIIAYLEELIRAADADESEDDA